MDYIIKSNVWFYVTEDGFIDLHTNDTSLFHHERVSYKWFMETMDSFQVTMDHNTKIEVFLFCDLIDQHDAYRHYVNLPEGV